MLVSHRHRFIYTKTRKTAGTSVEAYFEPYCVDDPNHVVEHYRDELVGRAGIVGWRNLGKPQHYQAWWNHMPASTIKRRLGKQVWKSYFKFCVIRNPFDKAVSRFYFDRKLGRIEVDESLPDAQQFEKWLLASKPIIDLDKYTIDGKFCLNRVIRYERLEADMQEVCAHLGIEWAPEKMPKLKAGFRPGSTSASAASMYTPASTQAILRAFAPEFKLFGYAPVPGE